MLRVRNLSEFELHLPDVPLTLAPGDTIDLDEIAPGAAEKSEDLQKAISSGTIAFVADNDVLIRKPLPGEESPEPDAPRNELVEAFREALNTELAAFRKGLAEDIAALISGGRVPGDAKPPTTPAPALSEAELKMRLLDLEGHEKSGMRGSLKLDKKATARDSDTAEGLADLLADM